MATAVLVYEVVTEVEALQLRQQGSADVKAPVSCDLVVVWVARKIPRWSMVTVAKRAVRKVLMLSQMRSLKHE